MPIGQRIKLKRQLMEKDHLHKIAEKDKTLLREVIVRIEIKDSREIETPQTKVKLQILRTRLENMLKVPKINFKMLNLKDPKQKIKLKTTLKI